MDQKTLDDRVICQALRIFLLYKMGSDVAIGMQDLRKALTKAGYWHPKKKGQKKA